MACCMSSCYVPCLPNPDPSLQDMSSCNLPFPPYRPSFYLNRFGFIGIFLCACWIVWHFLLPSNHQRHTKKCLLLIIINLINPSLTINHYPTTFLTPSVFIFCSFPWLLQCLSPISVNLCSHLLLNIPHNVLVLLLYLELYHPKFSKPFF